MQKKAVTFLLSVLTSDWLKQQKLTKLHKAVLIYSSFEPCQGTLSFSGSILALLETLHSTRARSLLSMRCLMLGYSFEPRLNRRALVTAGSIVTFG